jgi:hypothetical protein
MVDKIKGLHWRELLLMYYIRLTQVVPVPLTIEEDLFQDDRPEPIKPKAIIFSLDSQQLMPINIYNL